MSETRLDCIEGDDLCILVDALHAIQDHALDADCDGHCVESMADEASGAFTAIFDTEDWTYDDIVKLKHHLRQIPQFGQEQP